MAGEDLRRRIFLTESETGQTLCLRPEFTIPVCLDHIASRADTPRRYAYLGEVFRQRREGGNEFFQAGIEDLGETDTAAADARSVADAAALLELALPGQALTVTLGDQAVFEAVLAALGLPRGWQKRLARAFGAPELLASALADLARPATAAAGDGLPSSAVGGDLAALAAQVAAGDGDGRASRPAAAARPKRSRGGCWRRPNSAACGCRTTRFAALKAFLAIHVPLDRAADALAAFAKGAGLAARRRARRLCGARRGDRPPRPAARRDPLRRRLRPPARLLHRPGLRDRRCRALSGRWPAAAATTAC